MSPCSRNHGVKSCASRGHTSAQIVHHPGGAPMPSPVVSHTAQRNTSDERTTGGSTGHHQLPGPAASPAGPVR